MHDLRGIQNPYRCHWFDKFQKIRTFFSGKTCSRGFGVPGCHPNTLINLVNTALASRDSLETICTVWEDCRTHRVVTGPMNFKKKYDVFFEKSCSRDFGAPACQPSTLIHFVNTALASRSSVETICMIWEHCRTHRVVTGPMNFKKSGFFSLYRAPGILGPWLPSRHFI